MYMWDVTVAKRGTLEVASCLHHFFRAYRMGARSLVSFSDGWGGQNKNLTIVSLYNELNLTGVYDILNHKFLTGGHTFLRHNTDFVQIEKRKASTTVHVPSDWWFQVIGSVVKKLTAETPLRLLLCNKSSVTTRIPLVASTQIGVFLPVESIFVISTGSTLDGGKK